MTKFIVLSHKVDRSIRKFFNPRYIRKVGFLTNSRLKGIVLHKSLRASSVNDRIIDFAQRGILSAEVDKGTGEVVFVFTNNEHVNDFLNVRCVA